MNNSKKNVKYALSIPGVLNIKVIVSDQVIL